MDKLERVRKERLEAAEKATKIVDRFPTRDWNLQDFVGKYHLSKFANQLHPLPGTQVAIEKEYELDKDRFKAYQVQKQEELEKKLLKRRQIKELSTQLQTKVYFETVFGAPIEQAEQLLTEKERLIHEYNHPSYPDDQKNLDRFWKNCQEGKSHYVGYAVANGFKSIDYQDPVSGDSALHTAMRNGDIELLEELLKYKANPDVKNKLGSYPIHEAWTFWNTDPHNRSRDERLEQEDLTCKLLLTILSYGAFADALDFHKQTALHIGCRLGTVRAVKVLLTFHADMTLRTKYDESAIDLCIEFEQYESHRLLLAWDNIRSHFVHSDFHSIWHKFLADYQEDMKMSKPAEVVLSELELENNAKMMARLGQEHRNQGLSTVMISDPLIQAAFYYSTHQEGIIPKPWENGWRKYVKSVRNANVVGLQNSMANLKGKLQASRTGESGVNTKGLQPLHQRRVLPDMAVPLSWSQKESLIAQAKERKSHQMDDSLQGDKSTREELSLLGMDDSSFLEDVDSSLIKSSASQQASTASLYDSVFSSKQFKNEEQRFFEGDPTESSLTRRRKYAASKVCLDAKFLKFTNKLSTDSALMIPLRSAAAPLQSTDEQHNILRFITAQGKEFEHMDKHREKNKLEEMYNIARSPEKNSIGAYSQELIMDKYGERDALFGSLSSNAQSVDEILHHNNKDKTNSRVQQEQRAKLDMVGDRRPRYVDAALLPAVKTSRHLDDLIREEHDRQSNVALKKQGLLSQSAQEAAKLQMQEKIAKEQADTMTAITEGDETDKAEQVDDNNESLFNQRNTRSRQRSARERNRSIARLFLEQPQVQYGLGRLVSSHRMKGKLEEPWTTVGSRYQTIAGDRTA